MGKERVAHQKNLGVDSICSRALSTHSQHGFSFFGQRFKPVVTIRRTLLRPSETSLAKVNISTVKS
jgi:hypothetical protein